VDIKLADKKTNDKLWRITQQKPIKGSDKKKKIENFFFFLGPVCVGSGSTSAFKAYCAKIENLIFV
jgi:hypothetical protein